MNRTGTASADAWLHDGQLKLRDTPMIFMYHGVADADEDPNQLCVSPARFAEQMAWLARRGLRGVGIAELVDAMRAGRQRGLVGLTFDDGYTNVLETALPVLRRHGFGATAYIISDRLGGTNEWDEGPVWQLMTADQVRELAAAGIEAILTFVLIFGILLAVSSSRSARWTPLVAWGLVALLVWQGGDLTGASLNPARSLAPALLAPLTAGLWAYIVGPLAGSLAAVAAYGLLSRLETRTAKLLHDPAYPSTMAATLPVRASGRETGNWAP